MKKLLTLSFIIILSLNVYAQDNHFFGGTTTEIMNWGIKHNWQVSTLRLNNGDLLVNLEKPTLFISIYTINNICVSYLITPLNAHVKMNLFARLDKDCVKKHSSDNSWLLYEDNKFIRVKFENFEGVELFSWKLE